MVVVVAIVGCCCGCCCLAKVLRYLLGYMNLNSSQPILTKASVSPCTKGFKHAQLGFNHFPSCRNHIECRFRISHLQAHSADPSLQVILLSCAIQGNLNLFDAFWTDLHFKYLHSLLLKMPTTMIKAIVPLQEVWVPRPKMSAGWDDGSSAVKHGEWDTRGWSSGT